MPPALTGAQGLRLVRRVRRRLVLAIALANLIGLAVVIACIWFVLPGGDIDDVGTVAALNGIVGAVFLVVVVPLASVWGESWLRAGRRWIQEERPPTDAELTAVLRAPLRLFFVHTTVWLTAAAVFTILNAIVEFELVARVGFTVALAGLVTSAFAYLLAERITRPLAKAALSISTVSKPRLPGITTRTIVGWTLGSGIPLVGLITVGIFAFLYAWNDFMMPSLIISDPALQTLPVRQNLFQTQFSNNYNVSFASYLMAMAPAIVAYLFTQRWVMEGVTQGAVKG